MKSAQRRRNGYVLVMTLAVVVIAAVLLVSVARLSINNATAVRLEERQLQTKWGSASCTRVAFENQTQLLSRVVWDDVLGRNARRPIRETSNSVRLGGQVFSMRLVDESAKLDLNVLLEQRSETEVAQTVASLSDYQLPVTLYPLPKERFRDQKEDAIESWMQVFEFSEYVWPSSAKIQSATEDITCWSRQMNFYTASDTALYEAVKTIAGSVAASRVQSARRDNPSVPFNKIATQLNLTEKQLSTLRKRFTDSSQTQSLWLKVRDADRRLNTQLHIRETILNAVVRFHSFSF